MDASSLHEKVYQLQTKFNRRFDRIFILPTRFGLYFILIIFILFLMSLSYGHSLAFTGTFLFVSIIVVSAHFTNFNLSGIKASEEKGQRFFFSGEDYRFTLYNSWARPRVDVEIEVTLRGIDQERIFILHGKRSFEALSKGTMKLEGPVARGVYHISKIKASSAFPFGLFRAWIFIRPFEFNQDITIFPAPLRPPQHHLDSYHQRIRKSTQEEGHSSVVLNQGSSLQGGSDHFHEHTPYREGDETKRIDWKIYSRTHELYQKHYHDPSVEKGVIDRREFSSYPLEEQLSYLCFKVLEYSRQGQSFALILNGEDPRWGQGKAFERECLMRLSEF